MDDQGTMVTGPPAPPGGLLNRGDVLVDRYEVRVPLGGDGFTHDAEAFDRIAQERVLLRVVDGSLLPTTRERDEAVERLRSVVGVAGEGLPGLLDVVSWKQTLLVVEPWPSGTNLRNVVAAKQVRGNKLSAEELLPVVAGLACALGAMPEGWHHGGVTLERVWIDPSGLQLSCPFVLQALPPATVASKLRASTELRDVYAPERCIGMGDGSSDRFGVAALALEGLTGRAPQPEHLSELIAPWGEVGKAIEKLLGAVPTTRPDSLAPLIEALAREAGLPVPELNPRPFARQPVSELPGAATDPAGAPAGSIPGAPALPRDLAPVDTQPTKAAPDLTDDEIEAVVPTARTLDLDAGATHETEPVSQDTGEILAEDLEEPDLDPNLVRAALALKKAKKQKKPPKAKPAKGKVREGDDLDPDLVQAALGIRMEEAPTEPSDDDALDPRLVRAALGVELSESSPPAAKPSPDSTDELDADDLEMVEEVARALPSEPTEVLPGRGRQEAKPAALAEGKPPLRRELTPKVVLDASITRGAPPTETMIPTTRPGGGLWPWLLVLVAGSLLAALIIGVGLKISNDRREQAARDRAMQERFERLQQEQNSAN